jgi:hypothetical protein
VLLLRARRKGRYLLAAAHGKHGKHAEEVTTTITGDNVEETVTTPKKHKHNKAAKVRRTASGFAALQAFYS